MKGRARELLDMPHKKMSMAILLEFTSVEVEKDFGKILDSYQWQDQDGKAALDSARKSYHPELLTDEGGEEGADVMPGLHQMADLLQHSDIPRSTWAPLAGLDV